MNSRPIGPIMPLPMTMRFASSRAMGAPMAPAPIFARGTCLWWPPTHKLFTPTQSITITARSTRGNTVHPCPVCARAMLPCVRAPPTSRRATIARRRLGFVFDEYHVTSTGMSRSIRCRYQDPWQTREMRCSKFRIWPLSHGNQMWTRRRCYSAESALAAQMGTICRLRPRMTAPHRPRTLVDLRCSLNARVV